jgi:hypothetical protein
MQSMIPMLSDSPALTFAIAPHFVWVMLAMLLVAGLAIAGSALRAEHRRRVGAGTARPTAGKPAGRILRHVERPIAA